jgi:hypothetical protein
MDDDAVDIDTDDEDQRAATAPATALSSGSDHSGNFRPVLTRSLSGTTLNGEGKQSVFAARSRNGSASGDVLGAPEDRSRSISGGSVTSTAPTSVFRPPGGSVFSRPGGSVFKTPAPFKPQSRRALGDVSQPSSAPLPASASRSTPPAPVTETEPEPEFEPEPLLAVEAREELMVEVETEPSPMRAPPPIMSAFNLAPPTPFDEVAEDVHTPVDEHPEDLPPLRQHVGRFGAVNLMTPIAERTMEYTGARSVGNTPSRGQSARESQRHALLVANQLAEELREEDEEAEPAPVAQMLFSAARASPGPEAAMDSEPAPYTDHAAVPSASQPCNPYLEDSVMFRALDYLPDSEGYHNCADRESHKLDELQRFAKKASGAPTSLVLDGRKFLVSRKLGEGSFGAVFSARDCGKAQEDEDSDEDDEDELEDDVALKVVRPPNEWEFAVIRELHQRLPENLQHSVIVARELFVFHDESVLALELCTKGTLLDMVNRASSLGLSRAGQPVDELVVMFFAIELLRLVEGMHAAGIIHGDLKIDNCLVRLQPAAEWAAAYSAAGAGGWAQKGVALIDFGRAVDTRAFAPGQAFVAHWDTDARDCPELREGRSWTFQTDYFGLAGIVYCMLFGKHLDASAIVQQDGRHRLATPVKRYWQGEIWNPLFEVLLNPTDVHSDGSLPLCDEIGALRGEMELWLGQNSDRTGQQSLRQSLKRIERGVL